MGIGSVVKGLSSTVARATGVATPPTASADNPIVLKKPYEFTNSDGIKSSVGVSIIDIDHKSKTVTLRLEAQVKNSDGTDIHPESELPKLELTIGIGTIPKKKDHKLHIGRQIVEKLHGNSKPPKDTPQIKSVGEAVSFANDIVKSKKENGFESSILKKVSEEGGKNATSVDIRNLDQHGAFTHEDATETKKASASALLPTGRDISGALEFANNLGKSKAVGPVTLSSLTTFTVPEDRLFLSKAGGNIVVNPDADFLLFDIPSIEDPRESELGILGGLPVLENTTTRLFVDGEEVTADSGFQAQDILYSKYRYLGDKAINSKVADEGDRALLREAKEAKRLEAGGGIRA